MSEYFNLSNMSEVSKELKRDPSGEENYNPYLSVICQEAKCGTYLSLTARHRMELA